jgi:peptidoglycan/xylan/chitin deacetylase (PgdA/CDA1 family)
MEEVLIEVKKSFQVIPVESLIQYFYYGKELKNCCHITFDDGHKSFYEIVFPLLLKHEIPVSLFLSPIIVKNQKNFWFQEMKDYDSQIIKSIIIKKNIFNYDLEKVHNVGAILKSLPVSIIWSIIHEYQSLTNTPQKPSMNMNKDQLLEVYDSGLVNIGAHTLNHPILSNESNKNAENEIKKSVVDLRKLLQDNIKTFAYPNGKSNVDFTVREMTMLKDLDIKLAFSTDHTLFSKKNDPLSIPRFGINGQSNTMIKAKIILEKKWNALFKLKALFKKNKQEIVYRKQFNYSNG